MPKKKSEKEKIVEQLDNVSKESPQVDFDADELNNPMESEIKSKRGRKCKVQTKTKPPSDKRNSRSRRVEKSCNSTTMEEQCSIIVENNLVESDDKNISEKLSSASFEPSSSDPLSEHSSKSQFKIHGDKYAELLNVFNGKEEEFNNFIKHYNIWQQSLSCSEKKSPIKKKTYKKNTKPKISSQTPVIKLVTRSRTSKKKSSKRTILENDCDAESSLETLKSDDVEKYVNSNPNLTEDGLLTKVSSQLDSQLDSVYDVKKQTKSVFSEKKSAVEHKSGNVGMEEVGQKSRGACDVNDKTTNNENRDLLDGCKFQEDKENVEERDSKGIDLSDVSKIDISETFDYIGNKSVVLESSDFLQCCLSENSNLEETTCNFTEKKKSTVIEINGESPSLEKCDILVSSSSLFSNQNCIQHEVINSLEQVEDYNKVAITESDDVTDINPNEETFENESILKRKRCKFDEDNCVKKKKIVKINDSITNDILANASSLETSCNKWNSDEANLLSDELIYSDDEKNSSSICNNINLGNDFELAEDFVKLSDEECSRYKDNDSRSDGSLLDLHERKDDENLVSCGFNAMNCTKIGEVCSQDEDQSINSGNLDVSQNNMHCESKEGKKNAAKMKNKKLKKLLQQMKNKNKINKISCKSKTSLKANLRKKNKHALFSLQNHEENVKETEKADEKKNQDDYEYDDTSEYLTKKMKNKCKKEHKSILESDLPIVEVTYKGELLHGILGSDHGLNFCKKYRANIRNNENLLDNGHSKDILKQHLRPLCCQMLRSGACEASWICNKEHSINSDFFKNMNTYDAWLITAFVLRISDNVPFSFYGVVLTFLSNLKAKKKILLVSQHIFLSKQSDFSYMKSCWNKIFEALECCGLQKWEAMKIVVKYLVDHCSSLLNTEVVYQLLKLWNVQSSALMNTWSILEPLLCLNKITLPPIILSKIIAEIIAVDLSDKKNGYRLIVQQLCSLSQENLNQISYRLLNDFIRKLAQEGFHSDEKTLRDRMKFTYYSPFCSQQSPPLAKCQSAFNPTSLRRCRSMTNLSNVSSDNKFHNIKVHEEEKMEAATLRALQCSNYESIVNVISNCSKKSFISNILYKIYMLIKEKHTYAILKTILTKTKEYSGTFIEEVRDLIGNIVVTVMLDYVKQYNWKEANIFYSFLDEYNINKYKLKSLTDSALRPVRLAVIYSEVHYYNGRYKESIGVFISTKLLHPDPTHWLTPGGTEEDFRVINVMVSFLMNELMNKKVINIATMLFKAILEVQSSLSEPIDIGGFFECLLYKLFEQTDEYPETAVKLYLRVYSKDSTIALYGLTYRALLILAYRNHRRSIIKDLLYKAIDEYAYPIIEENENIIMLLRSQSEEEIIVYISEWVARFKEKVVKTDKSVIDYQIQIKFKDVVLEDFLDDQVLGIPALLKEIDQSFPGATKRLEFVLKRLHLKFRQIKKDTLSIEPLSFENFLNKIKV